MLIILSWASDILFSWIWKWRKGENFPTKNHYHGSLLVLEKFGVFSSQNIYSRPNTFLAAEPPGGRNVNYRLKYILQTSAMILSSHSPPLDIILSCYRLNQSVAKWWENYWSGNPRFLSGFSYFLTATHFLLIKIPGCNLLYLILFWRWFKC